MSEGELKEFVRKMGLPELCRALLLEQIDEAAKEYPKVSQKWVPTKGRHVDWKTLCLQMEQKIIEFENFGKKWLGELKK
jgi:hypothetical protein